MKRYIIVEEGDVCDENEEGCARNPGHKCLPGCTCTQDGDGSNIRQNYEED